MINNIPQSQEENQDTIQRSPHDKENPFVMILKKSIRDPNLSIEAKGMLAFILSFPSDWKVNVKHLMNTLKIGRDKVKGILNNLIDSGYMCKESVLEGNLKRGVAYFISESPIYLFSDKSGGRKIGKSVPTKYCTNTKDISKDTNIISVQNPESGSKPPADLYFCLDQKKFIGITSQDKENWKIAYPSVEIDQELMKIEEWLRSEPTKAKLKKKWRKCITGWLSRTDERKSNQKAYQASGRFSEGDKAQSKEEKIKNTESNKQLLQRFANHLSSQPPYSTDPIYANSIQMLEYAFYDKQRNISIKYSLSYAEIAEMIKSKYGITLNKQE